MVLGAAIFVVVRRTVSEPLSELSKVVRAVADGDLTQSFQSGRNDEIGALVQEVEGMRQRYQTALSQVHYGSGQHWHRECRDRQRQSRPQPSHRASRQQPTAHGINMGSSPARCASPPKAAREANPDGHIRSNAIAARGGEVVRPGGVDHG